jgi:trans-aconitate methyltransferase
MVNIFLFFLTFCLFCLVIFVYVNLGYSFYLKVPMLSSGNSAIEKVLSEVDLGKVKKFYDLGSGSGKVISQIANRYPELECVGIEYNAAVYCCAKLRNIFLKQKVAYRMENFFKVDLSDADVVYTFLFPGLMERLETKFARELKKGALVIDTAFPLKSKEPKMVIQGGKGKLDTLYVYEY